MVSTPFFHNQEGLGVAKGTVMEEHGDGPTQHHHPPHTPLMGDREQRLFCIPASDENLYKIEMFWLLLFFPPAYPCSDYPLSPSQKDIFEIYCQNPVEVWFLRERMMVFVWLQPQEEDLMNKVRAGTVNLEITRMSHSVHQAHTLTPHQNKILSLAKTFSVRDFCSPGSSWSGIFFTAGTVFQYSPLLLALIHSLLSSDQHNLK